MSTDSAPRRFSWWPLFRNFLAGVIAAMTLLPLIYGFSVSVRPRSEVFGDPHLIPYEPTLEPYVAVLDQIGPNLVFSLFTAVGVSILVLGIAIPGAYAFARLEFPGRRKIFYMIVLIMLLPIVGLIIPLLTLWHELGLYNTILGLWLGIVPGQIPVALWIFRDYFQKLPPNIEEAAMVYGTTRFGAFTRVVLPLAAPAMIAVAFLGFLWGWNAFLFPNLLTTSGGPRPAIVNLFTALSPDSTNPWPYIMAMTFTIGLPPAVMYVASRRYLEDALSF
ncbi:carbohydrate ABC transporter permease [Candidatus Halobonum tyrrellensis]|uniref:Carbohydrate ABC transporter membrane protein 2, CUT1 family n=1 Tax=Candidatus Halobonum tyrrellensis G22 TaxID=1324957 RepID=V4IV28_9EURY|nr:carbohydrate ABC transporter permease [Candidatus Halobonum tyrrellensis]ESP87062.1 carbohydrate ABC transporter membrane protein 2, CUT1 family [Candidatus Halobonum tyrrellensis G22]